MNNEFKILIEELLVYLEVEDEFDYRDYLSIANVIFKQDPSEHINFIYALAGYEMREIYVNMDFEFLLSSRIGEVPGFYVASGDIKEDYRDFTIQINTLADSKKITLDKEFLLLNENDEYKTMLNKLNVVISQTEYDLILFNTENDKYIYTFINRDNSNAFISIINTIFKESGITAQIYK